MEHHHLRCFVAVAEELHFGRAAERLCLTPSPVSRAVRELERELGGALFTRGYHRVELTELGGALVPHARRVLDETERLKARARELAPTRPQRRLRLGVSTLCPPEAFEAVADLLGRELVGSRVDLDFAPAASLLPELEAGGLDLALVQLPLGRPSVSAMVLAQYQVWVVMRADDSLTSYDALNLGQLAGRSLTLGSPRIEPVAMAAMIANLRAHGVVHLVEMPEFDHVRLAAQIRHNGGLALTLHPDTGGSHRIFDDRAFHLVPLTDEGFKFSLGAAWQTAAGNDDRLVRDAVAVLRGHWSAPPDAR